MSFIAIKYAPQVQVAIDAKDLEIRFGDVIALSNLTLQIPTGTSVAVVGANGSGKSTLLGAIARLHKPAAGTVSACDDTPALVLQATEVAAGLPITVRDTIKLARYPALGMFRRFRDADNHAIDVALARMQVTELAGLSLHQLSGGQRQRVLMAQGLAQESDILLLDEPMTGLDVTSRRTVLNVIGEEIAAGRTVVMTTHSLADAEECDLTLLLQTEPVAFGPPDDVLTETNLRRTFGHRVVYVGDEVIIDDHHVH